MPIDLLQPTPSSWAKFRAALNECEQRHSRYPDPYSIFANIRVPQQTAPMERMSLITTISEGRRIITNNLTWGAYDIAVLLGLKYANKSWALGGFMGAKGTSAKDLTQHQDVVHPILQKLLNISGHPAFIAAAVDAIKSITAIDGFGMAIATRLIMLARPDRAVSINGGSSVGFSKLYELNGKTTANYRKLLSVIYEQPWYKSPAPSNPDDQHLWSMRAALLDPFVYGEK